MWFDSRKAVKNYQESVSSVPLESNSARMGFSANTGWTSRCKTAGTKVDSRKAIKNCQRSVSCVQLESTSGRRRFLASTAKTGHRTALWKLYRMEVVRRQGRDDQPGARDAHLPRQFHAGGGDESLSVRLSRRPGQRMHLLGLILSSSLFSE